MANTLKTMAAICMLVLTMMGQLMAPSAASASSAPLVQADTAPTARRLLSADHERSSASDKTGGCVCNPWLAPQCCFGGLQKQVGDDCPCSPLTMWCCFGLQKKTAASPANCPCHPATPWCCFGLQKTAPANCPCHPMTPWCCFGLQKTAPANCLCSPMTPWCCYGGAGAGSAATN